MRTLRLTHPELDFWVDVRLRGWDGRWLAVADFADEPDVGTGTSAREAIEGALAALGPKLAAEIAEAADLDDNEDAPLRRRLPVRRPDSS